MATFLHTTRISKSIGFLVLHSLHNSLHMQIFILAIILIALAIAGIAIKMFIKPGGTFTKTCGSSFDPKTGRAKPCSCHSEAAEECEGVKD